MYLESVDPEKNRSRFYSLETAPSLFGSIILIRRWGRIGSRHPQTLSSEYQDIDSLLKELRAILRRRHRHGYQLRQNRLQIVLPGAFMVADGVRRLQLIARQTPGGITIKAG